MSSQTDTFIKYVGVDYFPQTPTPYFKQLNKNGIFALSDSQYPIQDLLIVNAKPTIEHTQLFHVPDTAHSNHKLLVYGQLLISFQYATNDANYSIHYDQHLLPFSEYLTLPSQYDPSSPFTAKVLIEDIYSYILTSDYLYHNITLLITAQSC